MKRHGAISIDKSDSLVPFFVPSFHMGPLEDSDGDDSCYEGCVFQAPKT